LTPKNFLSTVYVPISTKSQPISTKSTNKNFDFMNVALNNKNTK